jgi:hypothetical protein
LYFAIASWHEALLTAEAGIELAINELRKELRKEGDGFQSGAQVAGSTTSAIKLQDQQLGSLRSHLRARRRGHHRQRGFQPELLPESPSLRLRQTPQRGRHSDFVWTNEDR